MLAGIPINLTSCVMKEMHAYEKPRTLQMAKWYSPEWRLCICNLTELSVIEGCAALNYWVKMNSKCTEIRGAFKF